MKMRTVLTVVAMAAAGFGAIFSTAGQSTGPATATAPATTKAAREVNDVLGDLKATSGDIRDILDSPKTLMDESKRVEVAPKLVPLLSRMLVLMNELGEVQPEVKPQISNQRFQMLAMLSLLGDAPTKQSLDELAAKKVDEKAADAKEQQDEVLQAKLAKNLSAWWAASKDAGAQEKILADMSVIAKGASRNDQVTATLMMMSNMGSATKAMASKAEAVVTDSMTGRLAAAVKERKESEAKKGEGMGKPIVLAGKTVDGKDFSTAEYKGKVVLVDFWATWCGPCVAELPRVKEIYAKYHDQGLEIVGISCDSDGEKLAAFTKEKGMPWVQLWDKDKQNEESQWHPLAKQWNVDGIPTMFLIDRSGVLRSVTAREEMEELIPKLLEEKAGSTQAAK